MQQADKIMCRSRFELPREQFFGQEWEGHWISLRNHTYVINWDTFWLKSALLLLPIWSENAYSVVIQIKDILWPIKFIFLQLRVEAGPWCSEIRYSCGHADARSAHDNDPPGLPLPDDWGDALNVWRGDDQGPDDGRDWSRIWFLGPCLNFLMIYLVHAMQTLLIYTVIPQNGR